uniref:Uncharacterized protein n=1 Tax=Hordeum vulgare subsp. vulgare TaxID=112509 RepID=A0A8I6XPT1_HORVV
MVTKLNQHHHRKNSLMYSEFTHQYISTRETTIKRKMYPQVPSRKFEISSIISTIIVQTSPTTQVERGLRILPSFVILNLCLNSFFFYGQWQ